MKTRSILFMIAGILQVHFLVLYLFILGGGSSHDSDFSSAVTEEKLFPRNSEREEAYPTDPAEFFGQSAMIDSGERLPASIRLKQLTLNYNNSLSGALRNMPGSKIPSAVGILVDMNTGKVIWHKQADKKVAIASMSKIMTLFLAYQTTQYKKSGITMQSPVICGKKVLQIPPTKVNLQPDEVFTLEELMKAAAIKSANDAAHQIAEFMGNGDADVFVERMNRQAKVLGMKNTQFFNPHGLPGKNASLDNKSTMEDLALLCYVFAQYPDLMKMVSTRQADFRNRNDKNYVSLVNHNHLLPGGKYQLKGVNGIKTGFTNRAGSCVAVTYQLNGKHLLAILAGYPSAKDRDQFARQLLLWGAERI